MDGIIEYLKAQLEVEKFLLKLSEDTLKREQENVEKRTKNVAAIEMFLNKAEERTSSDSPT